MINNNFPNKNNSVKFQNYQREIYYEDHNAVYDNNKNICDGGENYFNNKE